MREQKYTHKQIDKLLSKLVILIDTREQSNFHITNYFETRKDGKIPYISKKLDYGDYSIMLPACEELGIMEDEYFTDRVVIERKNSLMELSNNLGNDRERFERELERSKGATFVLMVEDGSYKDIVNGRYSNDEFAIESKFKPLSFVATLATYRARHGIFVDYVNKSYAGNFIYYLLYYWLRCYLKGEINGNGTLSMLDLQESAEPT